MSSSNLAKKQSNIEKYIENEKDISKYKISFLERLKDLSPSQKRILNIEREFVSLPLETIPFQDLGDVAAAISIYRTSRSEFFETYKIKKNEMPLNKGEVAISVIKKIKYLKKIAEECKSSKVQELNLVQNSELYYDLIKKRISKNNNSFDIEKKFLDSKDLKYLIEIEPSVLAKKRARAQICVYSIGQYISKSIPNIGENTSIQDLLNIETKLDNIVKNIDGNFFEFYNQSIEDLKNNLEGTMGFNRFLSKMHCLQDVLDFSSLTNRLVGIKPFSAAKNFREDIPMIGNIFFGIKKIITTTEKGDADKNIQNKVFGILIPIPHEGNEKMSLLYKNIYLGEDNISHLFVDSFSNVKVLVNNKIIYCKAILMQPFWKLRDIASQDAVCQKVLLSLIELELDLSSNIVLNDGEAISKINNKICNFINISSNSRVYSPKTRSEEEGIFEISGIIKSIILEIQKEYSSINNI